MTKSDNRQCESCGLVLPGVSWKELISREIEAYSAQCENADYLITEGYFCDDCWNSMHEVFESDEGENTEEAEEK